MRFHPRTVFPACCTLLVIVGPLGLAPQCTPPARAESPLAMLLPFKRIEADPNKAYELTEVHGPWLILAASFSGEGADAQARQLVLELRQRFKIKAYTHRQHYDFSQPVKGLGKNRFGEDKKMRHSHSASFDEIAVLVGNFTSVDDSNLEKSLQTLKYAKPTCLELSKTKKSTQSFAELRTLYRMVSKNEEKRSGGPMWNAFATRNPLLNNDNPALRGLDPLVVDMNKEVEFSLLKNPAKYTVKVATFGGFSTIKRDEIERHSRATGRTKLEEAAYNAHQLTTALRQQGIEAYEFHDRHESLVTIGSFDSVGRPLPNGTTEFNPTVCDLLKRYGAEQKQIPGQPVVGLQPKAIGGIPFDVQPIPIEVPRVSIAANYTRNRLLE